MAIDEDIERHTEKDRLTKSDRAREKTLVKLNASYDAEKVARGGRTQRRWQGASSQSYDWGTTGTTTWHQHGDEFSPWYDVLEKKHMVTGFRPSGVNGDEGGLGSIRTCFSSAVPKFRAMPKVHCMQPVVNKMKEHMTYMEVFLLLCSRVSKVYVYRYNKSKSLWMFGPSHPVRKYAILLTTNQYFEMFAILTILVNCVLMALSNAPEEAEYIFTAIYSLEMVLKIIARGFIFDKLTYLRDPWNWLDFSVVVLGYATIAPGANMNFSGIRTFRVLRALRAISTVQGLKTMVNALLRSMQMLFDVLLLTAFFLCVFALLGAQLFSGVLRSRCVTDNISIPHNSSWQVEVRKPDNWFAGIRVCGNSSGTMQCPTNYTCIPHVGPNPNYGYTNFDNFGWALLTSFQLLTLDYWDNVYFYILSSVGPWYTFYFILVIFFGSFLVFNLMLAVVAVSYQQAALQTVGKDKQFEQLVQAGFVHTTKRCSAPEFVMDGPVLEVVKSFPESLAGANVITVNVETIPASPPEARVELMPTIGEEDECSDTIALTRTEEKDGSSGDVTRIDLSDNGSIAEVKNIGNRETNHSNDLAAKLSNFCLRKAKKDDGTPINGELASLEADTDQLDGNENLHSIQNEQDSFIVSHDAKQGKTITDKFRGMVYRLITSRLFEVAIVIVILFNTICLAMEYHGMSKNYKKTLDMFNHVFTGIFILEMILKLIALGGREYLRSRWNIFDGLVVTISIVDLGVELLASSKNGNFTIIRSFRLFRVLKIANSWPTMRLLLSAMGRSINALANLTVILGIILYMFAVVGTQIFAKHYKPENFPTGEVPDWNFNNFGTSFLVIFRILCGEWVQPLYPCMLVTGPWTPIFFIAALIIGNFLILNLFLALLLGSFAAQSYEEEMKNFEAMQNKTKWINLKDKFTWISSIFKRTESVTGDDSTETPVTKTSGSTANGGLNGAHDPEHKHKNDAKTVGQCISRNSELIAKCCSFAWCLTGLGKMRAKVRYIKEHRYFDNIILFFIFASSFILIFEDIYLPEKPRLQKALEILNLIFNIIFMIEFLVKVTAMGVVLYFKNGWNILDFIIIIASIVGLFSLSGNLKTLRSIRTLRALRPLKAISRWSGVKMIVNSLIKAIPSIVNVVLVCMMFWLIFSILGAQFFGGRFYKCVDKNGARIHADLVPNRSVCLNHSREYGNATWKNSAVNFDNALNGFLALFQVATFEGWIEVMRDASYAVGVGEQPRKGHNMWAYAYFVLFVIIGSFVILNLFISVMIDNFYSLKKQQDDYGDIKIFLSPTQKKWLSTVAKSMHKKPRKVIQRPSNYYLGRLFDILCSAQWEVVLFAIIIVNMLLMMVEHYEQSPTIDAFLLYVNVVFTTIFSIEMLLKIVAFRYHFFKHNWNIFDLLIVILSIAELIIEACEINAYVTLNVFRVARVLRFGRLLRFFEKAAGIRRLLHVLVNSSASVFHMALLLFLLLFIYSIIGMTSFGHVRKNKGINGVVNFETFGSSMLVLLRVSTSAGWNEVLGPLMITPPDCNAKDDPKLGVKADCPEVWAAVLYFISYVLFSFLVVVNMHIAIILENFNESYQESENGITDEDLEMFYALWQLYDPNATQFVSFEKVTYVVANLGPPLGIPFPNKIAVHGLGLPLNMEGKVHCCNLLQSLIRRFYVSSGDGSEKIECVEMDEIIEQKRHSAFPVLLKDRIQHCSNEELKRQRAASLIQRTFRKKYKLENNLDTCNNKDDDDAFNSNKERDILDVTVVINDGEEESEKDQRRCSGTSCTEPKTSGTDPDKPSCETTSEGLRGPDTLVVQNNNNLEVIDMKRRGSGYHINGPSPTNYHSDGPTPSVSIGMNSMDKGGNDCENSVEENEHVITISPTATSRITVIEGNVEQTEKELKPPTPQRQYSHEAIVYNVKTDISIPTNSHNNSLTPSVIIDTSAIAKERVENENNVEEKDHRFTLAPVSRSRITVREGAVEPTERERRSPTPQRQNSHEAIVYNVQTDICIHLSARTLRTEDAGGEGIFNGEKFSSSPTSSSKLAESV